MNLLGRLLMVYLPFGMPKPNRQMTDANSYRYKFQGQEKDPETGKEAFQLRLWDGRIGRWLTTDSKNAHYSPYLGMANNPSNITDPDGGCPEGWDCFNDVAEGSEGLYLNEVTVSGINKLGAPKGLAGMDLGFSLPDFALGPRTFVAPKIIGRNKVAGIDGSTVYHNPGASAISLVASALNR